MRICFDLEGNLLTEADQWAKLQLVADHRQGSVGLSAVTGIQRSSFKRPIIAQLVQICLFA